jgi:hypothetical protein
MKARTRFLVLAVAGWLATNGLTAQPAARAASEPFPHLPNSVKQAQTDPSLKVSGAGSFSPRAGTARLTIENSSKQPIVIDQLFVGPLRIQANLSIPPLSSITRDFVVLDGPRMMSPGTTTLPVAFAPLGANRPRPVGTVNIHMETRLAADEHQICQWREVLCFLAGTLLATVILLALQNFRKE